LRKTKKILIIFLTSIAFQFAAFSILNWKADQLLNSSFRLDHAYSVDADLTNAEEFDLSYNNKYFSYVSNHQLYIIDLFRNKPVEFKENPFTAEAMMIGYKWLPDRNILIYVKNDIASQTSTLFSLDLDEISAPASGSRYEAKMEQIINFSMNQISDIQISTYTNNLYFIYSDQEKKRKIVRLDMMKNINRLDYQDEQVNAMVVSNRYGTVFLQTGRGPSKTIVSQLDRERTVLAEGEDNVLLGCQDNKIYIGKLKNNVLQSIRAVQTNAQGKAPQAQNLWQGEIPFDPVRIKIGTDDNVLIQGPRRLDRISNGNHNRINIGDGVIVLSDTGKMYMQITLNQGSFNYCWRLA